MIIAAYLQLVVLVHEPHILQNFFSCLSLAMQDIMLIILVVFVLATSPDNIQTNSMFCLTKPKSNIGM